MKTRQMVDNQCEQLQDDLTCLLDGLPNEAITTACQMVVNRFIPIKESAKLLAHLTSQKCSASIENGIIILEDGTTFEL